MSNDYVSQITIKNEIIQMQKDNKTEEEIIITLATKHKILEHDVKRIYALINA